ncbi:MAG: HAD family hydrolase, partial [Ignavibacteria bacterium]|nr:HAD family hydrolase [Ignavibacteria bacterium]
MRIKHIVFDFDGTLVDSNHTIYEATMKTFQKLKWDVDLPQHELDKRLGKHFKDIFRELDIPIPDLEHFIDVYKSLYSSFLNLS